METGGVRVEAGIRGNRSLDQGKLAQIEVERRVAVQSKRLRLGWEAVAGESGLRVGEKEPARGLFAHPLRNIGMSLFHLRRAAAGMMGV